MGGEKARRLNVEDWTVTTAALEPGGPLRVFLCLRLSGLDHSVAWQLTWDTGEILSGLLTELDKAQEVVRFNQRG